MTSGRSPRTALGSALMQTWMRDCNCATVWSRLQFDSRHGSPGTDARDPDTGDRQRFAGHLRQDLMRLYQPGVCAGILSIETSRTICVNRHRGCFINAQTGQFLCGVDAVGLGQKSDQPSEPFANVEVTVGEQVCEQRVVQEVTFDRDRLAQRVSHGFG